MTPNDTLTRNTEAALNEHFLSNGLLPEGSTRKDWYKNHNIPIKFGQVTVALFPILQREGPVILHDLHHLLTGYAPDWGGEVELAAWELASGGCGWHVVFWLDRLFLVAAGVFTAPTRLLSGFKAGRGCSNLYGMAPKSALRLDTDELLKYVGAE